jgi:hypothetical protein
MLRTARPDQPPGWQRIIVLQQDFDYTFDVHAVTGLAPVLPSPAASCLVPLSESAIPPFLNSSHAAASGLLRSAAISLL